MICYILAATALVSGLFIALVLWAACTISGRADDQER